MKIDLGYKDCRFESGAMSQEHRPGEGNRQRGLTPRSCILFLLLLVGCGTVPQQQPQTHGKKKVRVTYYTGSEVTRYKGRRVVWGNKTASGIKAKPGVTVAADSQVPFGTRVRIPALAPVFGNDDFLVQDRGSAVESRKASQGLLPVVDVYCKDRKTMKWLASLMPPVLEVF